MIQTRFGPCRLLSLLVLVLTCASYCRGAFEHVVIGARPAGMGGTYVALADDPDAIFWNPSGLVQVPGRAFSAFLCRPFGIEDITLASAGYIQPVPWGKCGVGMKTLGTKVYRENTFCLSHSRFIRKGLCVGATLKIFYLKIDRYGSACTYGIDVGCLLEMVDQIYGGMCITNVNGPRLGKVKDSIPGVFSFGLRSKCTDELILSAEVQREASYGFQFHIGQEYRISQVLAVRTGLQTNPTDFTAGAGFHFGRYRLDYAFSSHSVLGLTHQTSLTIW